ncbi:MAG: hypothetical protein N2738_05255 [Thermodesulfovibrionales bacterium]|nr:hypothetical protein [Thermodesulfovibrionales bacterium]
MSNDYEKDYRKKASKETKRARGGYGRKLSKSEIVLQEEIFTLPIYEIENYLESCLYIRKREELERYTDDEPLHDHDPDDFDLLSEYGEDPYDNDGDFSEADDDNKSIYFKTDETKTNRLSIQKRENKCDIIFLRDESGNWEVISPIFSIIRHFETSDINSYEGEMRLHFLKKRHDILIIIAKYLANLMKQKKLEPTEENRKYFFLFFPEFTPENIKKTIEENIHESTFSRLNNTMFHIPVLGDISLGEILDITRNAETHGKVINLIIKEDKRKPLKDIELAEKSGKTVRTIKYIRERYGIPNAYQRKMQ